VAHLNKTVTTNTTDNDFTASIFHDVVFKQIYYISCKIEKGAGAARLVLVPVLLENVSGYGRHRRSVVAYSAEVAHHAVPIR